MPEVSFIRAGKACALEARVDGALVFRVSSFGIPAEIAERMLRREYEEWRARDA